MNDLTVHAMTVGAFVPLLRQLDKMLEKAEAFAVTKKLDAGVIEGTRIGCGGDEFEGGRLDGCDLLVHGRARG